MNSTQMTQASGAETARRDNPRTPQRRRTWRRIAIGLGLAIAVFSSIALYGAYIWMPAEDGRAFQSPYLQQMGSKYADTPLARFHYIKAGSGSPVVLISPGATSVIGWKEQVPALAEQHTVYVVDLPGQGYTELHDDSFAWDLDAMTGALGTFLDAVEVERTALVGNSWSGGWALAYAQQHPDRVTQLALLDPTGIDEPGTWMWEMLKIPVIGEIATKLSVNKSMVRRTAEGLVVDDTLVTDELVDELWAPMTFHDNLRATYLLERRLDWSQTERAMPTTRTPTLVLWGKQDEIQPVERAARFGELLPNATVHIIDQAGHAPQLDQPAEVNQLLRDFLQ